MRTVKVLLLYLVKMSSTRRMKYEAKFKIKVVEFTNVSNNCAGSRKFGVNKKSVISRLCPSEFFVYVLGPPKKQQKQQKIRTICICTEHA